MQENGKQFQKIAWTYTEEKLKNQFKILENKF